MPTPEYSGDKRGRVRIPRKLVEQIVALNRALADWAEQGCDVLASCGHEAGACPWHWLDGVRDEQTGMMGIAPLLVTLEIRSPWTDIGGEHHWGLQGIEGAIGGDFPYQPDYYWTSVHPEGSPDLRSAETADLPHARLEGDPPTFMQGHRDGS